MRTEENVFRFLDRISANGEEIPSLRTIRSEVGGGSLGKPQTNLRQRILTLCLSRSVKNN